MATVRVPGTILVQIDEADLPVGPAGPAGPPGAGGGGGVLRQHKHAVFAPGGATSSTSFVGTGRKVTLTPQLDGKVRLVARGMVSHTEAQSIVHFTFLRNGVALSLGAGVSGVTAVRCISSDYAHPFRAEWVDEPAATGPAEYELAWRVHSGTAHLGKRPTDTTINVSTVIEAMEVAP
jgi:hypothetical protein